jgi:DNA polymerase-3 subunit delta
MIANAYYLWGEESYLTDRKIKEIIAELVQESGDDPEIVLVDTDTMTALELGQTLDFSPLFALTRVVIIKRPLWLGKSTRKLRKTEESLQVLQDYFGRDNNQQVLILTSIEHNNSNPVARFLDQHTQVINIKTPSLKELEEWCNKEFSVRGIRVAPATLKRIANSGQNMYYLENLIEKLSLMGNQEINLKEVDEQLDSKEEIKLFKLTDALLNRSISASLTAFYQLQEQGEHHLLLLHMISRQFLTLSKIKFYQEMGFSRAKIVELSSQKDFVVKKMMEKSSRFSAQELRIIFRRLLETDRSFKQEGKDPRVLMEALLVELCGQVAGR